ncbi:hypothetical protein Q1695_007592 [Nippostrongylus brasiliensis]|nr:hypothetical protein Q1695_007592 [Nippostrongylus brasiliensis]
MINQWIILVLVSSVHAQYYGGYYGRYGWSAPLPLDPYNAANPYAMNGMITDPALSGMCVDTNMQCPVWASTGQCATNVVLMRRMCALSCGTCGLGGIGVGSAVGPAVGIAPGIGYGGLAGAPLGAPILGRSIYEQGILRTIVINTKLTAVAQEICAAVAEPLIRPSNCQSSGRS